jgi:hypothetical protein
MTEELATIEITHPGETPFQWGFRQLLASINEFLSNTQIPGSSRSLQQERVPIGIDCEAMKASLQLPRHTLTRHDAIGLHPKKS